MYYYYKMKNKNIILGILAILIIVFLLYGSFSGLFSVTEGLPDPIDDNTRNVIMEYINNRISPDNPDGTLTDDAIISNIKVLGVNNPQINSILTSMRDSKEGVNKFAMTFGQPIYDPLKDGLVIHYDFDRIVNKNGQNVFENKSKNHIPSNPNNYDAIVYQGAKNPQPLDKIVDKKKAVVNPSCLYLNGLPRSDPRTGGNNDNGAYLKIPTLPTCYDSTGFLGMSYSLWVCATELNAWWSRIFDFATSAEKYDYDPIVMPASYQGYSGTVSFHLVRSHWSKWDFYEYGSEFICDSKWRHIVWSISKTGKYSIYINGKLVNANRQDGVIPGPAVRRSNFIGRSNWAFNGDDAFNGWMDDFRMYQRELTKDDVAMLYSKGSKVVQDNNVYWIMQDTRNQWYANNQGGRKMGKIKDLGIVSNTQMTVSFWINISKTYNNWRNIFIMSNNSTYADHSRVPSLYLYPHNTRFHFRFASTYDNNDGIGKGSAYSADWDPQYQAPLNTDVHITYVIQDKTIQFFVNGVLNYSRTLPASTKFINNTSATELYMAVYHNCHDVKLKNFIIFNRALLPNEVSQIYERTI